MLQSKHVIAAVAMLSAQTALAGEAHAYRLLENESSELCVDIPGFNNGDHVTVQQYPCNGGYNQLWVFTASTSDPDLGRIRTGLNGKCLEVPSGQAGNNVLLEVNQCNGYSYQYWYREDFGNDSVRYRNFWTNKCIDIAGGTSSAGFYVQQYTCHNGTNQRFPYLLTEQLP